jgi:hypothetical protein
MRRGEHRQINAIHDEGKMRTSLIGRSPRGSLASGIST